MIDFAALKPMVKPEHIKVFEFRPGLTVEEVRSGVEHVKRIWGEVDWRSRPNGKLAGSDLNHERTRSLPKSTRKTALRHRPPAPAGAGFAAFWVGGCVRDFLLGREPGDYDIATSALPEQIERSSNAPSPSDASSA